MKYCPQWSANGFANLEAARDWVRQFVDSYNHQHCHSRIRFVTPSQRHRGEDKMILARRYAVYEETNLDKPERWSGNTRSWTPVGAVTLNPEREETPMKSAA